MSSPADALGIKRKLSPDSETSAQPVSKQQRGSPATIPSTALSYPVRSRDDDDNPGTNRNVAAGNVAEQQPSSNEERGDTETSSSASARGDMGELGPGINVSTGSIAEEHNIDEENRQTPLTTDDAAKAHADKIKAATTRLLDLGRNRRIQAIFQEAEQSNPSLHPRSTTMQESGSQVHQEPGARMEQVSRQNAETTTGAGMADMATPTTLPLPSTVTTQATSGASGAPARRRVSRRARTAVTAPAITAPVTAPAVPVPVPAMPATPVPAFANPVPMAPALPLPFQPMPVLPALLDSVMAYLPPDNDSYVNLLTPAEFESVSQQHWQLLVPRVQGRFNPFILYDDQIHYLPGHSVEARVQAMNLGLFIPRIDISITNVTDRWIHPAHGEDVATLRQLIPEYYSTQLFLHYQLRTLRNGVDRDFAIEWWWQVTPERASRIPVTHPTNMLEFERYVSALRDEVRFMVERRLPQGFFLPRVLIGRFFGLGWWSPV
ncbi:hypothetical protein A1O1_09267 [Capronia coronata CBS 617.96]|uniref:Uncharacterized protein n=1 Tax=Capronia coronata CBS 617.96 TaxID=1182541 RepID=W9XNI8_9EURO|nr:uncharacterized protein A1O1_09267 [Capronia coronata CBS 617.96]EXJ78865.1 hypothetical protein A1O1_09267 [Capronia coronata CBS 617.96]